MHLTNSNYLPRHQLSHLLRYQHHARIRTIFRSCKHRNYPNPMRIMVRHLNSTSFPRQSHRLQETNRPKPLQIQPDPQVHPPTALVPQQIHFLPSGWFIAIWSCVYGIGVHHDVNLETLFLLFVRVLVPGHHHFTLDLR